MSAIVFDGRKLAAGKEKVMADKIRQARYNPRLGSVVFVEDEAGLMYTRLKKQAAVRVGVEFSEQEVSMKEGVMVLQEKIRIYCQRDDIDGVLIQKPMKQTWEDVYGNSGNESFDAWWHNLVGVLDVNKDVDCLNRENLQMLMEGKARVWPATVRAVVSVLAEAVVSLGWGESFEEGVKDKSMVVIGRSDIVGSPLAALLTQFGAKVNLYGSDLDLEVLKNAQVVISATGQEGLVKAEMVGEGAVVIDVGAPRGDVDFESVKEQASFITPVPGGVGPMTVVSLLENLVERVLG